MTSKALLPLDCYSQGIWIENWLCHYLLTVLLAGGYDIKEDKALLPQYGHLYTDSTEQGMVGQ